MTVACLNILAIWTAVVDSGSELTTQDQWPLYDVLLHHSDVFSEDDGDQGHTDKIQH